MKNMKISAKLIIGFIIVILLACIVGGVGIVGMSQINTADDTMYHYNLLPIEYIGEIDANYQTQRSTMRDIVMYPTEHPGYQTAIDKLKGLETRMQELFVLYEPTATDPEDQKQFGVIKETYNTQFTNMKTKVLELGAVNDFNGAVEVFTTVGGPVSKTMNDSITLCKSINGDAGKDAVDGNTKLFTTMTYVELGVLAIAIAVSLILAFYISSLISRPVGHMKELMDQVGNTGDLHVDPALQAALVKDGENKDEVGQSIVAFNKLIAHITRMADALEVVASKDLSGKVTAISDKDVLGNAIISMQDSLNEMFGEIASSTNQVSSGSVQIADGAQLLAQGATEQSATVEELSASISEIAGQTKKNAGLANEARDLGETIKGNAERGNQQMEQMIQAVREISEASQSIGKVIKIIDDIAFQTNILALNAAVEAARAGQHGKGFAVVADEVRSLAAKSAEAAKNTSELIASSIQKSELGAAISQETAESLKQIVEGILQSSVLVSDIAKSSDEQATAISQVSDGIDQVSQVVQQNSATAEESAAASEEMSGQATLLQQLIAQFRLRDQGSGNRMQSMSAPSKTTSSMSSYNTGMSMGGSKY